MHPTSQLIEELLFKLSLHLASCSLLGEVFRLPFPNTLIELLSHLQL